MTSTKRYDFVFLDGICSMESLGHEVVYALDIWPKPLLLFKIKSPQIIQIWWVGLSTHDNHVLVNESTCMVGPGRWYHGFRTVHMILCEKLSQNDFPLFFLVVFVITYLLMITVLSSSSTKLKSWIWAKIFWVWKVKHWVSLFILWLFLGTILFLPILVSKYGEYRAVHKFFRFQGIFFISKIFTCCYEWKLES